MRVLITGAGGFVGGYLCTHLLTQTDWDLLGTFYPSLPDEEPDQPRFRRIAADLRDGEQTKALLSDFEPEIIFHLAAQSLPSSSFSDPWNTLETNIRSQLNILEGVRQLDLPSRVLVIGSAEEYGHPLSDELPLTEDSPLRPSNPYAVSKVAQDFLGLQYHIAHQMDVVRLRPFNHTGPGRPTQFVVPAFASQIARIEAGLQEPVMKVGNLDAMRDFTDVRDIVRAYHLAATEGESGEVYNLASNHPQSIRSLLDTLISLSTAAEIKVETDPALYRPVDTPLLYGSAEKFHRCTGWQPKIPFEQTLQDVLDYWREQTSQ